jgi:hypothetical protein
MAFALNEYASYSERSVSAALPIASERNLYERYDWCLNPHLKFGEAVEYLRDQLPFLQTGQLDWQRRELNINIYLLACALLNSADEYLRGRSLRLPRKLANTRVGVGARWGAEHLRKPQVRARKHVVQAWRMQWVSALNAFLRVSLVGEHSSNGIAQAGNTLARLLEETAFPPALANSYVSIPSPFRRLDLSHEDVLSLGEQYLARAPDPAEPLLLVGLRTSGSYFAPLLMALFQERGYESVALLTMAPSKGPGKLELNQLREFARQGYKALILDDPPHTGGAITTGLNIVLAAGFDLDKVRLLVPVHPARRSALRNVPAENCITLQPEHWYKCKLLSNTESIAAIFKEYFEGTDVVSVSIDDSDRAEQINVGLEAGSDERGSRLKKVFDLKLKRANGSEEHKLVLAKSVGWGWLGYHAYFIAAALPAFVPQFIGMREGLMFMEWVSNSTALKADQVSRSPTLLRGPRNSAFCFPAQTSFRRHARITARLCCVTLLPNRRDSSRLICFPERTLQTCSRAKRIIHPWRSTETCRRRTGWLRLIVC